MSSPRGPHHLLVVDWDFFFENPFDGSDRVREGEYHWSFFDWGHAEVPFLQEAIWTLRAAPFLGCGLALPGLTGEQDRFWSRFQFAPGARLFYADSNAYAVRPELYRGLHIGHGSQLWLYDAHHDAGYTGQRTPRGRGAAVAALLERGNWRCDNWMVLYSSMSVDLHMRYPAWKTWGLEREPQPLVPIARAIDDGRNAPEVVFQRVFVCRSSAWVPPWNDLDAAFQRFVDSAPIKCREPVVPTPPRVFDEATARQLAMLQARA